MTKGLDKIGVVCYNTIAVDEDKQNGNGKCRSGGIGRRPGLKIPWEYIPYRFEPGFRHQNQCRYRAVEQLVARRAHNPEAAGSSPARATN